MQLEHAIALMTAFAERTGLTSDAAPTRYLWTDAFAVCNFLGLARATGNVVYRDLARRLVDQVHETLGRHREDDPRPGWLSGLSGEAARVHPPQGGLRIGKPLPERGPDEPFNQRLAWDRDGQYFHYLTKWMHALDLMARVTGETRYAAWSRELSATASEAFVYAGPGGQPRMYWKMSIDLTRPLVPSMGQHDPLDGYITLQQLRATAQAFASREEAMPLGRSKKISLPKAGSFPRKKHQVWEVLISGTTLEDEQRSFALMIHGRDWSTTDPLGLGGVLIDAVRLAQLIQRGTAEDHDLLVNLLQSAEAGLRRWVGSGALRQSARRRLAFRELGLAIGLYGLVIDEVTFPAESGAQPHLTALWEHMDVAERIVSFWVNTGHRQMPTWKEHQDINAVMLATALAPSGCLVSPRLEA
ncbi:MAG: hypothetical protein GVY30_11005 [Chloroflexi bacterium]|nr:hypothetical protein [Chloroflexota bacterium]